MSSCFPCLSTKVRLPSASVRGLDPLALKWSLLCSTALPEAALLEGKVRLKALAEYPTRQDNYAVAIAPQAWPPSTVLEKPFTWTRRLLEVKAA